MFQNEIGFAPREPEVLHVHTAARRLGCSPRTVRRLIQLQTLPARRAGQRRWVLLVTDVEILRTRRRRSLLEPRDGTSMRLQC